MKIVTICSGTNTAWVIQRYIRDPLLYKGRKFDIRHWVLLLHDGSMWALSDGSCRTASVPYVDGCWSNSFVHLTNHSVQVLLVAVVVAMRGVRTQTQQSSCFFLNHMNRYCFFP